MQDDKGWSIFKWAIIKQDINLIKTIFSFLQDVDKSFLVTRIDQFKRSYLHYAIHTRNNEIVKLLLDQCIFENDQTNLALKEGVSGQTVLHFGANILDAETFEVLLVKLLPNKFVRSKAIQKLDNLNQTLLHKALIRSDINILKIIMRNILSEDMQKCLFAKDIEDKTALHLAMLNGLSDSCVSFLLSAVNPKDLKSYVRMEDKTGRAAIHYLSYEKDTLNKLICLFQKVKSCSKDDFTYKQNIMDILLDCDDLGRSFLHKVILIGDSFSLKVIFDQFDEKDEEKKSMLLNLQDVNGKTALHYLFTMSSEIKSKIGLDEVVNLFENFLSFIPEKYIAYFLSIKDKSGNSPFSYSFRFFQKDIRGILRLLNKVPPSDRRAVLEARLDEMDNTILHYLARMNQERLLIEILKCVLNINDKKHLLELVNEKKASIIDLIQQYGILDMRLVEFIALFPEDRAFQEMLEKKLFAFGYLFDEDAANSLNQIV
ncbi:MAG: hypothetical protein KR126chlam5_00692 [Candidatus Anoxychlamydiales bacterium]|nr:hypothetical protein [Candidatus Anoxychlamydiales bacterium]